jgi:hypothetical protein
MVAADWAQLQRIIDDREATVRSLAAEVAEKFDGRCDLASLECECSYDSCGLQQTFNQQVGSFARFFCVIPT